jgi:predicted nucleic acid-binding protein
LPRSDLRVVVDTNVWVSGLIIPHGPAERGVAVASPVELLTLLGEN